MCLIIYSTFKHFQNIKRLNLKYYSILTSNIYQTCKLDLIFYRNNEDGKVGRNILFKVKF